MSPYSTWYEFKKDLEARLGCPVLNSDWLEARPREPLPWDETCLRTALRKAERVRDRRRQHALARA